MMDYWQKKFGPNAYFSFILDPFLLILFGMFIVWLTVRKLYRRFGRNKFFIPGLFIICLTAFWLIAGVGLYLDNIDIPLLGEAGKGNHFMWNSGCELLGIEPFVNTAMPTYADFLLPLNLLALFLFILVYPIILYVGVHLGYILFGRNEKQTGLIELLKPPVTKKTKKQSGMEIPNKVPVFTQEQVIEVVNRAREAHISWGSLRLEERIKYLKLIQRYFRENHEECIKVIQSETGKVWHEAMIECLYIADAIDHWTKNAERYLSEEIKPHWLLMNKKAKSIWQSKPVVGIISPWNLPLTLAFGEAIPALIAGSCVVIKPSSQTPLTSLYAAEVCKKIGLPENVFQVITGGAETGEELIKLVYMVAFCGSAETAKKVVSACLREKTPFTFKLMTPLSAELGGKTPFLVLKDANLERAANCAVWNSFANCGHYCKSAERIYVAKEIYEKFINLVVEETKKLRKDVEYGPLILPAQKEVIKEHIADAKNKGARVLCGGKELPENCSYFSPTVLIDVNHSMKIMREETFGPVLPIMKFENEKEVIGLANDCNLGLNAVLFSKNKERAEKEIAPLIKAGVVTINEAMINYLVVGAPQGGVKLSGFGPHRHGREGIQRFCDQKTILVHKWSWPFFKNREPWWFPYTKLTRMIFKLMIKVFR